VFHQLGPVVADDPLVAREIVTGCLTLLGGRVPVTLAIVPLIWAAIGGSSAFLLGVPADLGLVVAGTVLAYRTFSTSAAAPA